ncbi:potassium channel family protein [Nocardioides panacihumi]|uniref:Potassium channel family protein n=1 Tax=Nocardioides panacihumi TaxID=400774 RepID=A0ABP5DE65_9ACTN
MSGWRRGLRLTAAMALVVGFYFAVPITLEAETAVIVRLVLAAVLLASLTAMVGWQVRRHFSHPDQHIDGLLLALVVGVLGFALAFYVIAERQPGQFYGLETRVDSLYFTMTTLLTIGYGDVHAAGQLARVLVMIQMIFDVAVIATAGGVLTRTMRESAASRARRAEARRAHRKPP